MTAESTTGKRRYHHGDLKAALLEAAEAVLAEKGLEGFTLRECARRAGVSHAAPKHHFRDVGHLLTVLATLAFQRLNAAMGHRKSMIESQDARAVLQAIGEGYIAFAADNPHLFNLMFNCALLDNQDPELTAESEAAFKELARSVAAVRDVDDAMTDEAGRLDVVLMWSVVHGFSQLFIFGQFEIGRGEDESREAWLQRLSRQLMARLLALY
ncbi:TetR-like C-terminal domain-containing protein [Saccharospirillum salsuginis]|uniref:HTH tetR-type domain-containing protein n=1 Tax=Saccharospirillum salsuginis TaxID=418750 RepID=A0A918N9A0_9GAMM|nr:TetR-like C-terminal domain-containing protein [Saccharospirillum salsuginis]GGX49933.1 hypothetical protein GCM10007392_16670 [Saccharospirillum salsuginis]